MNSKISIATFLLIPVLIGCFDQSRNPNSGTLIELSLYTGAPGIARLGESLSSVTSNTKYAYERHSIASDSPLGKLGFIEFIQMREVGSKVYFRRDGVGMILAQEPFRGIIKGKKVHLFSFSVPPVSNWESHLIKELGPPDARASGGRFGSEGLFYNWGDISYNRMGTNEVALYRNPELTKYRLTNFGRELQLFPSK